MSLSRFTKFRPIMPCLRGQQYQPFGINFSNISARSWLSTISSSDTPYDEARRNLQQEEVDKLYRTVQVEMRGHDPAVMKSYSTFATLAANELDVKIGNCWAPKFPFFDRQNLCLLRAVHVQKNKRTQYEVRTFYRYMTFHNLTGSTADTFLEYIERNLPEGVALKVTKVALEELPKEVTEIPRDFPIESNQVILEEAKV